MEGWWRIKLASSHVIIHMPERGLCNQRVARDVGFNHFGLFVGVWTLLVVADWDHESLSLGM